MAIKPITKSSNSMKPPMKKKAPTNLIKNLKTTAPKTTITQTSSPKPSAKVAPEAVKKTIAPPRKAAPVRRAVTQTVIKKEVEPVESPKESPVVSQKSESQQIEKPIASSVSQDIPTQPRRVDTGEKRVSAEEMRAMTIEERYKLFRSLNRNPEVFVPVLRDLPKKMQMRKDEALIRKIIQASPPKSKLLVHYCPYCVDWQPYHAHSWTGYNKCCGCSMSSKDFYTAVDNDMFGKE